MTKNNFKNEKIAPAQDINQCNLCGDCNTNCPVVRVLEKETRGARHKAFLARKKDYKEAFWLCTLCGACIQDCPANIDIDCLGIREELVKKGNQTKANQKMRDNIKLYGNPFGRLAGGKKAGDKETKEYYT